MPSRLLALLLCACALGAADSTVEIADDDPEMAEAVAIARERLGEFTDSLAEGADGLVHFIKYEVVDGEESEFFWARVTAHDDEAFTAVIDNEPVSVKTVELGQEVVVPRADVADWLIVAGRERTAGGFSIDVVEKRRREGAEVKRTP